MKKSKIIIIFTVIVFLSLVFYGIFSAKNKIYITVINLENQDSLNFKEYASRIKYFVGISKNIRAIELQFMNYNGVKSLTIKKHLVHKGGELIELEDSLKSYFKDCQTYKILPNLNNNFLKALENFKVSDGNKQIIVIIGSLPKNYSLNSSNELIQKMNQKRINNKSIDILYMMTDKNESEKIIYDYFKRNFGNNLTDKRIGNNSNN